MNDVTEKLNAQIYEVKEFLKNHKDADNTTGFLSYNDRTFKVEVKLNPFAEVVNVLVTATDTLKSEGVYESYEQNPVTADRLKEIENLLVQFVAVQK